MHTFDKTAVITLRAEIEQALQTVAAKHGIAIKAGNASYSGTNVQIKLEMSVKDASGVTQTKEVSDFKLLAARYGLKPEDLGRTFTVRGKTFTLAGIDRKSFKYPILATSNGKMMKLQIADVKLALTGKREESAIIRDIANTYSGLSPENLSCDGELSATRINLRRAELNNKLRNLFAELGREITENEAYRLSTINRMASELSRR
jgi:hypothetical protein